MKNSVQKKWMLLVAFLFVGWSAMAQTPTVPAGAGTSGDPYQIATLNNLYWVTQTTASWASDKYFIQTADINASSTSSWDEGAGLSPIGNLTTKFQGNYNGQNHTINNLNIFRSSTDYVGLFGFISNATIANLGVTNTIVVGQTETGGLIARTSGACTVTNCFTSGDIEGYNDIAGGLIGKKYCSGTVSECYSTANIMVEANKAGGLIGACWGGVIQKSYSTGNVNAFTTTAGGFIGEINYVDIPVTVTNCYSIGGVESPSILGGFSGTISNGNISVSNCYSTGALFLYDDPTFFNGFVGTTTQTVTSCFWDVDTDWIDGNNSGDNNSGATGKTTDEMKTQSTFTDWDFADTWKISSSLNNSYPTFKWVPEPPDPIPMEFVITLPSNQTIELPLNGTVNCTVDWGDGSSPENVTTAGWKTHSYASAGTFTVSISGSLTIFGSVWGSWPGATYLTQVINFGNLGITSLVNAFNSAHSLSSVPALLPATVTNLTGLFYNSNVASVTNLNLWDVSSVTNMTSMFNGAVNFNQDIGNWTTSSVTEMAGMFSNASAFNQDISTWDVSSVTELASMFNGAVAFNKPLNAWQVGSVTNMGGMFNNASAFNQDISTWDVSSVTNMTSMFQNASAFNKPLNAWQVGSVNFMASMFRFATAFNQDISTWDVSSVTNMAIMFGCASAFNKPLNAWQVGSVTTMEAMFFCASAFNQDISNWDVISVTNMSGMFMDVTLSTEYYDAMLIAWDALTVKPNLMLDGGSSKYTEGTAEEARAHLISSDNWTINDGGMDAYSFLWDGSESSDWNTAGNWNKNAVPSAYNDIIILNVATAPIIGSGVQADCNNLTINTGATLTLNDGGSLITAGTIANNGTFNAEKDLAIDAQWHMISMPNNVSTANTFLGEYLQNWDESTATWTEIRETTTPLVAAKGYSLWTNGSSSYTFSGTPNTENQSVAISFTEYSSDPLVFEGANLLGNPYPSSIDWGGLDDTYGAVYYWNGSAYESWNDNVGSGMQYIPPMQGFFIVANATMISNTSGSFALNNANRTHSGATNFYKSTQTIQNGLVLETSNGNYNDELYIVINEQTNEAFEMQHDAYKMLSNTEGLSQLYSFADDKMLSIDVRPTCDVIQLGFQNSQNGNYSIDIKEMDGIVSASLEDTKLNTFHELSNGAYSFDWNTTDSEERFILHLKATATQELVEQEAQVYSYDGQVYIRQTSSQSFKHVQIFDLAGRVIYSSSLGQEELQIISLNNAKGAYLVQLVSDNEAIVQKVVLK